MKAITIDGLSIQEQDLRPLMDSFWEINEPGVVKNVQAHLVDGKKGCYNIKIHYQGALVMPFGDES
jgi:hypothetical protein